MAFTPDPNLFANSLGAGMRVGAGFADLFRQRRQEGELRRIAQMAASGNPDYNQIGAGLIGAGQVGAGVNALGVPYQREQNELQRDFQNQQFNWQRENAMAGRTLQERQFAADQEHRQRQIDLENRKINAETSGGGLFAGKGLQAQALNLLVENGDLNPIQAASLAAGKQVTGPNGEILFMMPQGIMAQYPNGSPFPYGGAAPQQAGQPAPSAIPSQAPQPTAPPAPQAGAIQLTGPKAKAPNDGQSKAVTFANRIAGAFPQIIQNVGAGTNYYDNAVGGVPLIGNSMASAEFQSFDRAKRDIINAILRRESGAAIGKDEFANADKQYFPQPGDSEKVIKEKYNAIANALRGLIKEAGPAWDGPSADAILQPILPPEMRNELGGARQTSNGVTWSLD